jgi:hypothetical protein
MAIYDGAADFCRNQWRNKTCKDADHYKQVLHNLPCGFLVCS